FLTTAETRIDFSASWILPHDTWEFVTFSRQTFHRLNTLTNPCTELEDFITCENNCFEKKMENQNITCRLPFLKSSSLPLCDNSASAKKVIQSYTKIYSGNVNARRDCNCNPPCKFDFHIPHILFDQTFQNALLMQFVLSLHEIESNFREIFKEELKLPLIKLVCDVGAIIGFYLGISFFSFLKQIPSISYFFNSYKEQKPQVYKREQHKPIFKRRINYY
uniref:Uncharacterized protein n=1 Tax=Strigamia maritima TaxID=126957 RepID=T1J8C5_STRMM